MRAVARRPLPVLIAVGVLALAGAAASLRLEPSAATDTLVGRSSDSFQATERFHREFGDEPIIVLVKGELSRTILTSDLNRVLSLEGCLSGNVPREGLAQLPPPCRELAKLKPAKVVYGPGTFINTSASAILQGIQARSAQAKQQGEAAADAARKLAKRRGLPAREGERLGRQAEKLAQDEFVREAVLLGVRYGLSGLPRIDDPSFVSALVMDPRRGSGCPKARFSYLFPSCRSAVIQMRLRDDLSEGQRERALDLVRAATAEETFRPQRGARYIVTGIPAVVDGLAAKVRSSIFVLLGAALLVMAATLALVFRTRLRLLPLALALAAAALTFGAFSLAGASLTMASIAALPVLIGLAVDYAIQFQARFDESRSSPRGRRDPADAAAAAAAAGGPTIAAAGLSTAVGFLVLLLSPVPMVRSFGVLLVIGIVLAFACAVTAGFAALVRWSDRRGAPEDVPPMFPRARERAERLWARTRSTRVGRRGGSGLVRVRGFLGRTASAALEMALAQPRRVLAIGLALAVLGWAAETQTELVSDIRQLVPRDLQALKDVNELQRESGVSGEIDVTLRGGDLTTPAAIAWMTRFQDEVLRAHGYKQGATCRQRRNPPELCPALSLPDLFRSGGGQGAQNARALLDAVPPYFSQAVITEDRSVATLAFGIRLMPLERQQKVIEDIQKRLNPPQGIEADVAGLPVLAAEGNQALASPWRRLLTLLAGLTAVFLVLLAVRRRVRLAAIPLLPIALATGWSALVLFLLQIPLNPMSATLAALVIAISTEFSVLLSARYQQERETGADARAALERTYASTGSAVLASGATAIAGFAALVASDIRMLRDFGISTVVDLTVSLLGVMVVLPAALVWAEQHGAFRLGDLDPRRLLRGLRSGLAAGGGLRPRLGRLRASVGGRRPRRVRRPRSPRRPRLPWRRSRA